jgi:hypothetical protein
MSELIDVMCPSCNQNPTAADDEGGLYSEWLNGEIEKPDLYDPADARL